MIFEEKQKLTQPWLWILLILCGILVYGIFGVGLYKQFVLDQSLGHHPMNKIVFLGFCIFVLTVITSIFALFIFGNLKTIINENEICLKFFPFHLSYKKFLWSAVERCEIITYKPVSEYGGWGIRYGIHGIAYNVKGKTGLQLYFKNGKRILIGTQKSMELSNFLKNNIKLLSPLSEVSYSAKPA